MWQPSEMSAQMRLPTFLYIITIIILSEYIIRKTNMSEDDLKEFNKDM